LPKNFSRNILKEIRRRLDTKKVEAIHFNHLDAAQYLDWLDLGRSDVKLIFDTHNILTTLYSHFFGSTTCTLRKAYSWIQWKKMCRYEQRIMGRLDCVIVCSELGRQFLRSWGIETALVVPNGVDTTAFFPPTAAGRNLADSRAHLVFTGAMDYLPNADGIRWFIRSVLPKLDEFAVRYRLTVVGKNPPDDLRACAASGKIEFTDRVVDVRPYTASANVFIVPLRIGGGTRLKILEALAMQIPIVSTRIGAEGLDLKDGIHLRVADEPSAMARAIAELCASPARALEIAGQGHQKILAKYTWEIVTGPLCEYYKNVLLNNPREAEPSFLV
jgi:glycosyltransferase involved in cell wall biosynthesis